MRSSAAGYPMLVTDRTVDVHGPEARHGRGTEWLPRVDEHLEGEFTEGEVDRWVRSACLLCSNGCGCDIAVKDGRMVGVRGRDHDSSWMVIGRRARGLRDELLETANASRADVERQLAWLTTRIKMTAPQALIVEP